MKFLRWTALAALAVSALANIAPVAAKGKDYDNLHEWVCSLTDVPVDSACNTYIFYWNGHNGMNWGMIYPDSAGMRMASGTTRSWTNADSCCSLIDTVMLLEDNAKTIKWAFDSLPGEARLMQPCKNETYGGPFYREMFVVKDGATVFLNKYDTEKYAGPNKEGFNSRFSDLMYLMLWVSNPQIREYVPTPCDRPHPHKSR